MSEGLSQSMRWRRLPAQYVHQLVWIVLVRTLRGSLLIGGALMVLAQTGTWQFFASSFAAHDMKRAAAWSRADTRSDVVMVAIDDVGFERFFGGHSPLAPDRFAALARTIEAAASQAQAIVVDLDLAPAAGESMGPLPAFFHNVRPGRWVLADPVLTVAEHAAGRRAWQTALCAAGVRFAHPFVPTRFGYAQGTHQFRGNLAEAALSPAEGCEQHEALRAARSSSASPEQLQRVASPLSAAYLDGGWVIPFQGDHDALRAALQSLQPRYVVIGGTWGRQDVIGTPFGDRFGLHQHAAALDGAVHHVRMVPYAGQLAWAWLVLSGFALLFWYCQRVIQERVGPWTSTWPGHRLLSEHLWPLAMVGMTAVGLLGVSEAAAILQARTGYWLPTSTVAAITLTALMFIWNWGRTPITRHDDLARTWWQAVAKPTRDEYVAVREAWRRWRGEPLPNAALPPELAGRRALAESMLAALSLVSQTILPIISLCYALTRPL